MTRGFDRRKFITALALPSLIGSAAARPAKARVVALDWALAETLLALGQSPLAIVAASDWSRFVVAPPLPPGVADLGLQQQINIELLATLKPDLILTSPFIESLDAVLPRIAATAKLSIFEKTPIPLDHPRALTRTVAGLIGREAQAEHFLAAAEREFDSCHARLAALDLPPVLVVTFVDARHARVYGGSGLFQNVLERIGVANAWKRPTSYWGFATVGVEALADDRDVHLVVVGPIAPDIRAALERSPIWYRLPLVRAGRIATLPPVFMFGAMPAALRFAQVFTERMQRRRS